MPIKVSRTLALLAVFAMPQLAQEANWTGPYKPCINSSELKKTGHMSLGVRYDISDPIIIRQFHRAFDFWERILDADFHDEPSNACAIAIVEASPALLNGSAVVARAQFPDRAEFSGWITIAPGSRHNLEDSEAVAVWAHEIGHLLGLKHNRSAASLMYFFDVDANSKLDSTDLRALALLHALRPIPVEGFQQQKAALSYVP